MRLNCCADDCREPMHISSLILHVKPDALVRLRGRLAAVAGVEVHAAAADGRMVVTLECEDYQVTQTTYETIERLDGVLSVAMIFQQTESDPDKEIQHAIDTA